MSGEPALHFMRLPPCAPVAAQAQALQAGRHVAQHARRQRGRVVDRRLPRAAAAGGLAQAGAAPRGQRHARQAPQTLRQAPPRRCAPGRCRQLARARLLCRRTAVLSGTSRIVPRGEDAHRKAPHARYFFTANVMQNGTPLSTWCL